MWKHPIADRYLINMTKCSYPFNGELRNNDEMLVYIAISLAMRKKFKKKKVLNMKMELITLLSWMFRVIGNILF